MTEYPEGLIKELEELAGAWLPQQVAEAALSLVPEFARLPLLTEQLAALPTPVSEDPPPKYTYMDAASGAELLREDEIYSTIRVIQDGQPVTYTHLYTAPEFDPRDDSKRMVVVMRKSTPQ